MTEADQMHPGRFGRAFARWTLCALAGLLALPAASSAAEPLAGAALVEALRGGGYVIYFRHAQTDFSNPDRISTAGDWKSCDPARVRQLSDAGRESARRVGAALRALGIPVGRVVSSEYCRCVETATLLDVGPVTTSLDLFNVLAAEWAGGKEALVERARRRIQEPPPPGTNTILVSHGFLLREATSHQPGEMGGAIHHPHGTAPLQAVATLDLDDWEALAKAHAK